MIHLINIFNLDRIEKEAQAYFGHQCCWSTICRYCRKDRFYFGYYWRYRVLRRPVHSNEAVIGKGLRIKQVDGDWLEGQIKSFRSESDEHEIAFDCGQSERHYLGNIEYEWKNDQGQKPIEQLGLQTGQILNIFDSISDATRCVQDASITGITAVCKNRCISAHGYFWRYKGSPVLPRKKEAVVRLISSVEDWTSDCYIWYHCRCRQSCWGYDSRNQLLLQWPKP